MNTVMSIAARDVMRRAREILAKRYQGLIANGWTCDQCRAHGMGTPNVHDPECPGVVLLRDIDAVLEGLARP